jgi:hypothetical protein
MKTEFKIVETADYILAVSGNPDGLYNTFIQELINKGWVKAYQPKGNTPELDLPLLPEIVIEPRGSDEFKYSEEDLRGAFISGKHGGKTETYMEFEEFIQSLKQPKTPVRFVAEITGGGEYLAGVVGGNEIWAEYPTKLKTTTNSEGKQVLVGTYLYE